MTSLGMLWALASCDALFTVSRHDLGPYRIAALGVVDEEATAAIWSGEGLFHDTAPVLEWSLNGAFLGSGWGVPVDGEGELELEVFAPDGSNLSARVDVGEAPAPFGILRESVVLGESLDLEARRDATTHEIIDSADSGEAVRVTLLLDSGTSRWMSVLGLGTVLEVEERSADLLAEEVLVDKGEVVSREPLSDGLYHHLVLALDGAGGNRWVWVDAAFGDEGPWLRHEGRLLGISEVVEPSTGLVAGTLVESPTLAGLCLTDLEAVTGLEQQDALACAPVGLPFRMAWASDGRCTRGELAGARVVLEVW